MGVSRHEQDRDPRALTASEPRHCHPVRMSGVELGDERVDRSTRKMRNRGRTVSGYLHRKPIFTKHVRHAPHGAQVVVDQ